MCKSLLSYSNDYLLDWVVWYIFMGWSIQPLYSVLNFLVLPRLTIPKNRTKMMKNCFPHWRHFYCPWSLSLLRRSPLHPLNKITQLRLSECHQLLLQAWEDQRLSTLRWRRKVFIWVANFLKKIKLMVLVSSLPFFSLDSCFL